MRISFFTIALLCSLKLFSQARFVINNNAFVVIDNGGKVVIQNNATNAVTTLGTGGNIVSENEIDQLIWMIGTSTGTYTVPWTGSAAFIKIPLSVNITAAGTGVGKLNLSTYPGSTWDNNTYRPSDVTHMNDLATGVVNNSRNVIDRFWIIDANGYTTKPTATLSFNYIDAEHLAAGNTITEANLGAQRFNNTLNIWGDYLPAGVDNSVTNVVSGVNTSPANFFRSWTLVDNTSPLPLELLSFSGNCEEGAFIKWSTASEVNNNYFTIEKSEDGFTYEYLTMVYSAGNCGCIQSYEYFDNTFDGMSYYRLSQTDFNGATEQLGVIDLNCDDNNYTVNPFTDDGNGGLIFTSDKNREATIALYDAVGKMVYKNDLTIAQGKSFYYLPFIGIETAFYLLKVATKNEAIKTFKLYLR